MRTAARTLGPGSQIFRGFYSIAGLLPKGGARVWGEAHARGPDGGLPLIALRQSRGGVAGAERTVRPNSDCLGAKRLQPDEPAVQLSHSVRIGNNCWRWQAPVRPDLAGGRLRANSYHFYFTISGFRLRPQ